MSKAGDQPERSVDPRRLRKASRPERLDKRAIRWMAELPADVRPTQVAIRFPHIANRFAQRWPSRTSTSRYFDELMLDQRGDRTGFPAEVALELTVLKRYHDSLVRRLLDKVWIDYLITD